MVFLALVINIAGAKVKGAEKAPEDGVKKPARKREVWTEQARLIPTQFPTYLPDCIVC